jgi:hypothetical protein
MRGEQPRIKEANHPREIFSSHPFSLDLDCNLAIHLSLISVSTCCRRTFSALKKSQSTSALTLRLKKKTLRMNRGPTINYAVTFGI